MTAKILKNINMKKFLSEINNEDVDLKAIGVRGKDKMTIISIMYHCYGLSEK